MGQFLSPAPGSRQVASGYGSRIEISMQSLAFDWARTARHSNSRDGPRKERTRVQQKEEGQVGGYWRQCCRCQCRSAPGTPTSWASDSIGGSSGKDSTPDNWRDYEKAKALCADYPTVYSRYKQATNRFIDYMMDTCPEDVRGGARSVDALTIAADWMDSQQHAPSTFDLARFTARYPTEVSCGQVGIWWWRWRS